MAGDQVTVNMTGGCPWGFRLFGGDEDPLVVAKLRKRSKAHDAGLQEGDVLLGINGSTCQGISHSTAMSLADSSGQSLSLLVLRGTCASDKYAVHAAFQALGSQLQPVSASALPQERSSGSGPVPSYQSSQVAQPHSFGQANGPGAEVRREEQTFNDGNTTRRVKTETRTEQFGGTTLTKVSREEVSQTIGGGDGHAFVPVVEASRHQPAFSAAPTSQPPMFQVSNVAGSKPRPGAWTPSGGGAPTSVKAGGMTITAPGGVHVQQHPDQSVTMTIGMHQPGKENVAPTRPQFNVAQSVPKAKPGVWQPSFVPAPPKPRTPPPVEPMQEDTSDWGYPNGKPEAFSRGNAPAALPMHLTRILHEGSGSDDCSSPGTPTGLSKKKKLFGDSAFYDDPQHKYPTIEEQVKMARRVAMSLMSPANTKARGHRMFVKRQQKASKWTKSNDPNDMGITTTVTTESYELSDSDEEKFFKADPWESGGHVWRPPQQKDPYAARRAEIPKAPVLPTMWAAPVIPKVDEEKTKALSAEEFERMRLYESKTQHTAVTPQACFALAADLHNMKGRGGKLFAKRKARAEKWVIDENNVPATPPNADFIKKLTGGLTVGVPEEEQPDVRSGAIPVNRLKQMIDIPKPVMTPWEAAMESGGSNIDKAFQHLEGITFTKKAGRPGGQAAPLDLSSPTSSISTTSSMSGPARMPEFSTKIKPWGAGGSNHGNSSAGGFNPAPRTAPKPAPRPPAKSWQDQSFGSSQPSHGDNMGGGGNFRPINFRGSGPGGDNKSGVFAPAAPTWQPGGGGGHGGHGRGHEVTATDGMSDL